MTYNGCVPTHGRTVESCWVSAPSTIKRSQRSPSARTLGDLLRGLRKERGLSQAALAEKAALSLNAISAFERGERFPRAETLDALVGAFELDTTSVVQSLLSLRQGRSQASAEAEQAEWRELEAIWNAASKETQRLIVAVARTVLAERSR